MATSAIKTTQRVIPMIYAYSTPQIVDHDGWVKIGYTESQTTEKRQKQQGHTADVKIIEEWKGRAVYEDETGDTFSDTDFHRYLMRLGIDRKAGTEWFHITGPESQQRFHEFRSNRGLVESTDVVPYTLRKEQSDAVSQTAAFARDNEKGEYLWNAKPRFGKTLSVYDFAKEIGAETVLIVTNRPAIANSWYADYEKFLGRKQSGYWFVSETAALKDKPLVVSRSDYTELSRNELDENQKCIEFVSLQDLKGAKCFGGQYNKLQEVADMNWDLLVIDEAHEGVDTYKTDVVLDHIKRKFTLHLSGTPFKAIANDKFPENAIFNWTYADEQKAKEEYTGEENNPYENVPQLNLFTYRMSDIVQDKVEAGYEIDDESVEYAFDLNEFFRVQGEKFVHEKAVDRFLDALTTQTKFPFSTLELRDELRHTFWLLNRVDSAKALAKKLKKHPIFQDYEIVLAAGDGKLDDEDETEKAFDKVNRAIAENEKTITLSVGQLTTGVTIPEWTAVLMLSNMKSPALYMQAAFRAQNPHLFYRGTQDGQDVYLRKQNAYVFDFDPARTLTIFEQFANDLASDTSDGRGSSDDRKQNVRELLNFFPVIGEDANGEMIELDAEKVLSIPRKIRSQEVVRRGFMSDFLFQNISNIFHAPAEVLDILQKFEAVKEPKKPVAVDPDTAEKLDIDEDGNISPSDEKVVGTAAGIFGDKVFGDNDEAQQALAMAMEEHAESNSPKTEDPRIKKVKEALGIGLSDLEQNASDHYGRDLTKREKDRWKRRNTDAAESAIDKAFLNDRIDRQRIEDRLEEQLQNALSDAERIQLKQEAQVEFDAQQVRFQQNLQKVQKDLLADAAKDIVETAIIEKDRKEKQSIESGIRDHLRGFSRTIPSFIMAYGDENLTLANFDTYTEPDVFKEVTGITLDQFRLLRDGGEITDPNTGEPVQYPGHLFDEVVFDDSVHEFLRKKEELANYFDEGQDEDIFSYVPPQRTNQIYTPRWVVQKMVDDLEAENPGCFDDPEKTFADLYMKSGLYITEIVKRLFRSNGLKKTFPDEKERIRHIIKEQVYGMAPTRIIYLIARNYILGFYDELLETDHNLVQADAAQAAKEGTLQNLVDSFWK